MNRDVDISATDIEHARQHIQNYARVFSAVFRLLIVLACAVEAVAVYSSIDTFMSSASVRLSFVASCCLSTCRAVIFIAALCIAERLIARVTRGASPFSEHVVKSFSLLAMLFLLHALLQALSGPAISALAALEPAGIDAITAHGGLSLNASDIIAGLVFFALSRVFRYGLLLQKVSDETV